MTARHARRSIVPLAGGRPLVGVFGSSRVREGDHWFREAERLGALLARAGYAIVSGGYDGVMAAASRGAAAAGGQAIGAPVRSWDGEPNAFLTAVSWQPDSYEQLRAFHDCVALVAVEGGTGTLAEVAFAWANPAVSPPLILVGREWEHLLLAFRKWLTVDPAEIARIHRVTTVDEVPALLGTLLAD